MRGRGRGRGKGGGCAAARAPARLAVMEPPIAPVEYQVNDYDDELEVPTHVP